MLTMRGIGVAALAVGMFATASSMAALAALDSAADSAYSGGWNAGQNGGFGFGAWVFADFQDGGTAGRFRATSSNADANNILTANAGWGTFANGGRTPAFAAYRPFLADGGTSALVNAQTFTVFMENGGIASNGFAGVGLRTGTGPAEPFSLDSNRSPQFGQANNPFLFGFRGGQGNYIIWDAQSATGFDTGIAFRDSGLRVDFTLVDASTGQYNLYITDLANTANNWSFLGRSVGAASGNQLNTAGVYNLNSRNANAYFNRLAVIPTPGAAALMGLGGLLAARRRR